MTTSIDNSQRVFMITGDMNRQIFCNMSTIESAFADMDDKDSIEVYEFWNRIPKAVTKKRLIEYLKANQLNYHFVTNN